MAVPEDYVCAPKHTVSTDSLHHDKDLRYVQEPHSLAAHAVECTSKGSPWKWPHAAHDLDGWQHETKRAMQSRHLIMIGMS
jgi:hypothetical protein